MLKVSMKMSTLNKFSSVSKDSKSKPSKKSSLLFNLFRSKPSLSVIDLGSISIDSTNQTSNNASKFYQSISSSDNFATIIFNGILKRESIQVFVRFLEKFAKKIPVGLGIFGGLYAIYQIYSMNVDHAEELGFSECISIIY